MCPNPSHPLPNQLFQLILVHCLGANQPVFMLQLVTIKQITTRFFVVFVIATLCCFGCKRQPKHPTLGFYHWRMMGNHSYSQSDSAITLRCGQVFIKVMDVDWSDIYGAYPTATFNCDSLFRNHWDTFTAPVTPVVFITNRTLEKIDSNQIAALANKILLKTEILHISTNPFYYSQPPPPPPNTPLHYHALQIDCDWTVQTRNKYFQLLQALKQQQPSLLLSATLRLHQYKYPKQTGVPPVDEVYLMCYNTGQLKSPKEENSIFTEAAAKPYFQQAASYPVKMNIALPFFSWTVIFRNGQFVGLDNQIEDSFFSFPPYVRPLSGNNFELLIDTVLHDRLLHQGDVLRHETISEKSLLQAANLCKKALNQPEFSVVFFDIDHVNATNYAAIEKAMEVFKH